MSSSDTKTAQAFANSWNNLPPGSVYTYAQYTDWMEPLGQSDVQGRRVLELGCGNGSLLVHGCNWQPRHIVGVDLGDSVVTARHNVRAFHFAEIVQADLVEYRSEGFDLVYCIGVLHHLKDPAAGFSSVLRNTRPGGKFHCWVYAREGNGLVVALVEPIRKVTSRLPWWITKYLFATPLVFPYFVYAKLLRALHRAFPVQAEKWLKNSPMREYSLWIAERGFGFFRHVAFDQLVTPQTVYLARSQIEAWLDNSDFIDPSSTYIMSRNGNSWKFGGRRSVNQESV